MSTLTSTTQHPDTANNRLHSSRLDEAGIVASAACAIHCLAAPFLLLLLPTAGSIWSHPAAHWILAVFVLPLAFIVVWRGYRKHRRRSALIAVIIGSVCIIAGLIAPAYTVAEVSIAGPEHHDHQLHAATVSTHENQEAEACTDECCPTITHEASTGQTKLTLPSGSVVTLIGSVFLVTAHAINLYGCRCLANMQARRNGENCCAV